MLLQLNATSISLRNSASPAGEKSEQVFSFSVCFVDDFHYLSLETGEVFQNRRYAKVEEAKKEISALLTVGQALNSDYRERNEMTYEEGLQGVDHDDIPSKIYFQIYLPPDDFRELASNARSGLFPSAISLKLAHRSGEPSPVRYGWEPDGSGKIWNNLDNNNRRVKIESISFDYVLLRPAIDDATEKTLEPKSISELASSYGREIKDQLVSIEREIKNLGWTVLAGFVLIAFAIAYFGKH